MNAVKSEEGERRMERLDRKKKIYVAGHRGLVGSAFIRGLKQELSLIHI